MSADLTQPCPRCGAPAGQRCTNARGRTIANGPHEARTLAAPAPSTQRPGAWPTGSRPPQPARIGTEQDWQHATAEYRGWLTAGKPKGNFTCTCGCTPGVTTGSHPDTPGAT